MRTSSAAVDRGLLSSFAAVAFAFAAFFLPPAHAGSAPPLFGPPAFGADAQAPRDIGVARARNISVARHVIEAAVADLTQSPGVPFDVTLNLFDDATWVAQLRRVDVLPDGTLSLSGAFAGDPLSSLTIVSRDGVVSANFQAAGRSFQVRSRGQGVHETREMDMTQFREQGADAPIPSGIAAKDGPVSMTDDGSTIDVMVVYTPAARAAAGGTAAMQSLVNLGIAETNAAYASSGVVQRVRLVYAGEVSYTEATGADLRTDLDRLTATADLYMDEVHTLRNTYGADVVSLWVETPSTSGTCGIGWFMSTVTAGFASSAFNVVARTCATGYYSFGHEMGHNMGLRHDTYMDAATTPYPYAHGYVDTVGRFRTIMAYNNQCDVTSPYTYCPRIQYFSNPTVLYGGRPTGVGATADARLALNNTALTVANFRTAVVTTVPGVPATSNPSGTIITTTPTYYWTAVAGATSYDLLVQTPAGADVFLNSYTAAVALCSGGGTCAATPTNALPNGGSYNWFVRARNSSGTSGWSVARAITIAAVPSIPVTSNPSGVLGTATPTYYWAAVGGAAFYDLLVQTPGGADVFLVSYTAAGALCAGGTGACAVTPANALANGGSYNWFVRARNATGTSGWSAARGITIATVPDAPVASNPSGTIGTSTPTYFWGAVAGAASYDLLVQTPGGSDVFLLNYSSSAAGCPGGTGACAVAPANPLANGSTYNWFVRARNMSGTSGWSATRTITINAPPGMPVPSQPTGTIATLTPTFLWTPAPGATSYNLLVSGSSGGFSISLSLSQAGCPGNTGACGYTPPAPLANGVAYAWRVSATNAIGTGALSNMLNFTTNVGPTPPPPTGTPPPVPVLGAPNGSTFNLASTSELPSFLWNPAPGATAYTFRLHAFDGTVLSTTTGSLAQVSCPMNSGACGVTYGYGYVSGATYRWSLRAENAHGASAYSTPQPFTIVYGTAPPPTPVPANPSGAIGTSSPMFLWNPAPTATVYVLLVMRGGTVVINTALTLTQAGCPANLGACGYTAPSPLPAGSYTWQVSASNTAGGSPYSAPMLFSTP